MDTRAEDEFTGAHFDQLQKLAVELSFGNADLAGEAGDTMIGGGRFADDPDRLLRCRTRCWGAVSSRETPGDADDSEGIAVRGENRKFRRGIPLEPSRLIEEHFRMIDQALTRFHEMPVSFHEAVRDLFRVAVVIGRAYDLREAGETESEKQGSVDMHKLAAVVLNEKIGIRQAVEKVTHLPHQRRGEQFRERGNGLRHVRKIPKNVGS